MSMPNGKFMANPDILCETEKDGMLLFDPHTGEVKILNETGALVYQLFKQGSDCHAVLKKLHEAYDDCDPTVVETDLTELVGQLQRSGLIYEISQEACR